MEENQEYSEFGLFWAILGNFGQFWAVMSNFVRLAILGGFWQILYIWADLHSIWRFRARFDIFSNFGKSAILGCFGH